MLALNRKVFRDLWTMRGQAMAIALVIASGAATYVMSSSTLVTLQTTRAAFYRDYGFSEVFANLKRAPELVASRIGEIPGAQAVETRVVASANLRIEGYDQPVSAQILSISDTGPVLNRIYLRTGRMPALDRDNEVVVNEAFATAHKLVPGSSLYATINGRMRKLVIAGIGLSPEYIYLIQPGGLVPDFKAFGVLWMRRDPLANAYDMDGAFNDVTITLGRGASVDEVIEQVDLILARYGGQGAFGRKDQISHRYLDSEFMQLEQMATIFPIIFYGVAAFLLNVVVTRLIATQREQVAVLKAFGYSTSEVVLHYLKLITLIVLAGVAMGVAFGAWLGQGLSNMYMEFYRFPFLIYRLEPNVIVVAAIVSVVAAILGCINSVVRAASLPPAVAMQPPAPPTYRRSIVERIPLMGRLAQPTRMIVRNLERRPMKSLLSVLGISFSYAILVVGGFFGDSVDYMVDVQFRYAQNDDISVSFFEPASYRAISSLRAIPGVTYVEPYRAVPVRLRNAQREYRTSIQGMVPNASLRRVLDENLQPATPPRDGLLLTDHLAQYLGVRPGDSVIVQVLEGQRRTIQVPVSGTVKEYIGVGAYMELEALNRVLREGPAISGALMRADSEAIPSINTALRETPRVAAATIRKAALANFYETMAKQVLTFAFFNTILAGTIAFGVIYNSARIAFAERSRELASLRVLGLTRLEVAYILLGELAILTLVALPAGAVIGRALGAFMVRGLQTDLFRIPMVIDESTYAFAAVVVLTSAVVSSLAMLRKIFKLDLVEVLKTRE
jgi:putative ABC transport system permease protein